MNRNARRRLLLLKFSVLTSPAQIHYMFGGNPGGKQHGADNTVRLSDFWSLKLTRDNPDEIIRKCK